MNGDNGSGDNDSNDGGTRAAGGSRRGRRAGASDTRGQILAAARELFAEHGFDGASLRQIARAAGVDSALVHHYFAGKDELFAACTDLPADPAEVLADVVQAVPEERAEVLLRALLTLWDSPAQAALLALLRGAVGSKTQAALIREVLRRRIITLVTAGLDGDSGMRGALAASQIMGLMMARYVLRLEPLASASHDDVVRLVAPNVQRYLTGELECGAALPGIGAGVRRPDLSTASSLRRTAPASNIIPGGGARCTRNP